MSRSKSLSTKKIATLAAIGVLLTGCAAMPDDRGRVASSDELEQSYRDSWAGERPAVTRVGGLSDIDLAPKYPLPREIRSEPLELEFSIDATLGELAQVLTLRGIPTIFRPAASASLGVKQIGTQAFEGSVGELLDYLEIVHGLSAEYRANHLILGQQRRYQLSVPQHEALVTQLGNKITALGGEEVQADTNAGVVSYLADPETHRLLRDYTERTVRNAAIVTVQVALLQVKLRQDQKQGVDWSNLSITLGDMLGSAEEAATSLVTQQQTRITGSGIGFEYRSEDLNVSAVLSALSQYGDAKTEQDVTLTTIGGTEVRIRSGEKVPYVSEVNSTTSGDSGAVEQGANVEVGEYGLTLKIVPYYDAETDLVTSNLEVEVTDVVQMREFEVGDGSTLTHPETRDLEFATLSRLRPGETTLVGGVTYDQVDRSYSSLRGLEDLPAGSKREIQDEQALFILLRPTVTVFTSADDRMLPLPGAASPCQGDAFDKLQPFEGAPEQITAVYFRPDQHRPDNQGIREIERIAQQLQREENAGQKLLILGYSDHAGERNHNRELSRHRASNVKRVAERAGLAAGRIHAQGMTYCKPEGEGGPSARERRAELWVIAPQS